jgi:hypothetical protein
VRRICRETAKGHQVDTRTGQVQCARAADRFRRYRSGRSVDRAVVGVTAKMAVVMTKVSEYRTKEDGNMALVRMEQEAGGGTAMVSLEHCNSR